MGSLPYDSVPKYNVLVVGSGGVGTMAAYAMEKSAKSAVTAVLRSNYAAVKRRGFNIDSRDHGNIIGWKPTHSKCFPHLALPSH